MPQRLWGGEFYGQTLARREVASFVLSETRYEPGLKIPSHSHEHAYFCLVREGTFSESLGKTVRVCEPSTINFHPAEEIHSDNFHDAGAQCLNLQIGPQWIEMARDRAILLDRPAQFRGGLLCQLATRLCKEMYEQDSSSSLLIEGLVLEILGEASRRQLRPLPTRRPKWLEEVRELIHAHFVEPLSLGQISRLVNVHPVHLARVFRQHHNCTVGDYVRRTRVDFASRELSMSDAPIIEIAYKAGFSDHSHFCKTFKRLTGQTPTEFRSTSRTR
jgi:AraC family transcriptional regulator